MKGDFTRHTFAPNRHFSGVRMQQGRVQLDADWNEQVDIARHRVETESLDALGHCGGPLHDAAFRVVPLRSASSDLLAQLGQFYPGLLSSPLDDLVLLPGRYYVDGILCQCEHPVLFGRQPDLPRSDGAAWGHGLAPGVHLLYLDVWERHLTALEAPPIRETALGGPDTATRTRTVWQVRSLPLEEREAEAGCGESEAYRHTVADTTVVLRARALPQGPDLGPCVLPASAGFTGLENQLYRVEIHHGGAPLKLNDPAAAGHPVTAADPAARTVRVSGGSWPVGTMVELYPSAPGSDPMAGTLAQVASVDPADPSRLTLTGTFPAPDLAAGQPRLRAVGATFKWSRDNGIVATRVVALNGDEVEVESLGPDGVLDVRPGHWVELYDDLAELHGRPGQLLQVESRNDATRTLTLRTPAQPLAPPPTPRLRRWDGVGAVKTGAAGAGYATLEDGVQVRFEEQSCRTGEYWLIPARTAAGAAQEGGIEWPLEAPGRPAACRPLGILHHHCRLAVVRVDGEHVEVMSDCRCLFAPATAVNALAYVSGAGQEGMPDLTTVPATPPVLGLPLVVGVANGHCNAGARVRFEVVQGDGRVDAGPAAGFVDRDVDVDVGLDGLARCWWKLGTTAQNPQGTGVQHQLVSARLLEQVDANTWLPVQNPVLFNASLSVAREVAYDPHGCGKLNGMKTVQSALDRVVDQVRLYPVAGHGQEVMPGQTLPQELQVLVASACGPMVGKPVHFQPLTNCGTVDGTGTGSFGASADVHTGTDGIARVRWKPNPAANAPHYQEVKATLGSSVTPAGDPAHTFFGATLSTADQVAYTPGEACARMNGVTTVADALAYLCQQSCGCEVSVGESGTYPMLKDALALLDTRPWLKTLSICLLPGIHEVQSPLKVTKVGASVKITGGGAATSIHISAHGRLAVTRPDSQETGGLASFILRDLTIASTNVELPITVSHCQELVIEACRLTQSGKKTPVLWVDDTHHLRITGCRLESLAPRLLGVELPADQAPSAAGELLEERTMDAESAPVVSQNPEPPPAGELPAEREPRSAMKLRAKPADARFANVAAAAVTKPSGTTASTAALNRWMPWDVLHLIDVPTAPGPTGVVYGQAVLQDNLILGYVRLYGSGEDLDPAGFTVLAEHVAGKVPDLRVVLEGPGGDLHLRGNTLNGVRVDSDVKNRITVEGRIKVLRNAIRHCHLSGNVWTGSGSAVLAWYPKVDSNHFQGTGEALHAAGTQATAVGNTGEEGTRVVLTTSVFPQPAGNSVAVELRP